MEKSAPSVRSMARMTRPPGTGGHSSRVVHGDRRAPAPPRTPTVSDADEISPTTDVRASDITALAKNEDNDDNVTRAVDSFRTALSELTREDRQAVDEFHDAAKDLSPAELDAYVNALRPTERTKLQHAIEQLISDAKSQRGRITTALAKFGKARCRWRITTLHIVAACGADVISRTMLQEWHTFAESGCQWDVALESAREEMRADATNTRKGRPREWRKEYIASARAKWEASTADKGCAPRLSRNVFTHSRADSADVTDSDRPSESPRSTPSPMPQDHAQSACDDSSVASIEVGRFTNTADTFQPARGSLWGETPMFDIVASPSLVLGTAKIKTGKRAPDSPTHRDICSPGQTVDYDSFAESPIPSPPVIRLPLVDPRAVDPRTDDELIRSDASAITTAKQKKGKLALTGSGRQRHPSSSKGTPRHEKGQPHPECAQSTHKRVKIKTPSPVRPEREEPEVISSGSDGDELQAQSQRDMDLRNCSASLEGGRWMNDGALNAALACFAMAAPRAVLIPSSSSVESAVRNLTRTAKLGAGAPLALIPQNIGDCHWVLAVVDGALSTIASFDSLKDRRAAGDVVQRAKRIWKMAFPNEDIDTFTVAPPAPSSFFDAEARYCGDYVVLCAVYAISQPDPKPLPTFFTGELVRGLLLALFSGKTTMENRTFSSLQPILKEDIPGMTITAAVEAMKQTTERLRMIRQALATLSTLKAVIRQAHSNRQRHREQTAAMDKRIGNMAGILSTMTSGDYPEKLIRFTQKTLKEEKRLRRQSRRECYPLEPELSLMTANMWLDLAVEQLSDAERAQKTVQEETCDRVDEELHAARQA